MLPLVVTTVDDNICTGIPAGERVPA
jgi:hypothetical protein